MIILQSTLRPAADINHSVHLHEMVRNLIITSFASVYCF